MLATLALLFAPVAGAQARPCHHPAGQLHAAAPDLSSGLSSGVAADHQIGEPERVPVDHKACCGALCAVCVVATAGGDAAPLRRPAASPRFDWSDQAGSGVALQPRLGPPRLPV